MKIFQKGFNFSQDGPGNRLVYHLQGCNLCCPWCANPESMPPDSAGCVDCPVDELEAEILRSRLMFLDGGGVTFTGGEPTMQFDALRELLGRLRVHGIDTAIETNASHPRLPELFPLINHLMMDIKHYDAPQHARITGLDNRIALENLQRACREHPDVLVRIPLVNGYNACQADLRAFIRLFQALPKAHVGFELLSYHEYGRDKWAKLGKPYAVTDGFVSPERIREYEGLFRDNGFAVVRS